MKSFLIFIFISIPLIAQINYETRAVWIATNYGLDWPRSLDSTRQKVSLREIFDSVKAKNLNTVYFQVRGNGYVMFRSSYEDYSPFLTRNNLEQKFDPLQYAVKLARERNLEIHAWVNVLKVFSSRFKKKPVSQKHLLNKHPAWLYKTEEEGVTSYWMNPALPEARNYVVKLISELVRNYDVDGVHLDFLRYSNSITDWEKYGGNKSTAEIKRQNITKLLEEIFYEVKKIKPFVEVGVTPVGINKNSEKFRGMEGYGEVYQDAEEWAKRGIVDYLVPQIYWNLQEQPKFEDVLDEWLKIKGEVNLIAGIAAYKNDVKNQIDEIIKITRRKRISGAAFFRFENIKDLKFRNYSEVALPQRNVAGFELDKKIFIRFTGAGIKQNKISIKWEIPDSVKNYVRAILISLQDGVKPGFESVNLLNRNTDSVEIRKNLLNSSVYYVKVQPLNRFWKPLECFVNEVKIVNPLLSKFTFGAGKPLMLKTKDEYQIIVRSPRDEEIKIFSKANGNFNLVKRPIAKRGINVYRISAMEKFNEILVELNGKRFLLKVKN